MTGDENRRPVLLMVPRRAVVTILTGFICLFIGVLASFQYANYIDRRSNQKWCGIIETFNSTYRITPPPSAAGKTLEAEFKILAVEYKCK